MRRVIAVIQARTGSTRLPRKVLRDLGGRTVLEWVVTAARESGVCDEVIVATTTDADDDAIEALATEFARRSGARSGRGCTHSVPPRGGADRRRFW